MSDAFEPGSRVAPNQTSDLPKRLVEATERQLECTLEGKIEHLNRQECQGRAPSCRKGCESMGITVLDFRDDFGRAVGGAPIIKVVAAPNPGSGKIAIGVRLAAG